MTSTSRLLAALLALAWAAASCAGDDDDVATSGTASPGTEVTVVVDGGEFDRLTYTVTCGSGGPAVDPVVPGVRLADACSRLADADVARLLVEGPPADRICTEIYGGPQHASITGRVDGRSVDARITRANGCEIDTWDRLLAGLLPPTVGVAAEG